MPRYLDPKNDIPFKKIFGENRHLLISFLNALMPLNKGQRIVNIEYLTPEQVPANPEKKNSIVDVRCKDNRGRQFIVEMQMYWNTAFKYRLQFNIARAYSGQLKKGMDFCEIQPVYGLGLINDVFDTKTDEFYHHFRQVNIRNTNEVIEGLEMVLLELPKFKPAKMSDRRMSVLWLRFMREIGEDTKEVSPELLANEQIAQAIEICEHGRYSDEELLAYDAYWDIVRTEQAYMKTSFREGEAKGRAEGEAKGRAEGEAKGRAEGEAERLKLKEELAAKKAEIEALKAQIPK